MVFRDFLAFSALFLILFGSGQVNSQVDYCMDYRPGTCICQLPNGGVLDLTHLDQITLEAGDSNEFFRYFFAFCFPQSHQIANCYYASCCQTSFKDTTTGFSCGNAWTTRFELRKNWDNTTERLAMVVDSTDDQNFKRRTVAFIVCKSDEANMTAEVDHNTVDPDGFHVYFLTLSGIDFCPTAASTTTTWPTPESTTTETTEGSTTETTEITTETTTFTLVPITSTVTPITHVPVTTTITPITHRPIPPEENNLSAGSVLLIIAACIIFVYLLGGFLYQTFVVKSEGVYLIPNYTFWRDFPSMVKDGVTFLQTSICGATLTVGGTGHGRMGEGEEMPTVGKGQYYTIGEGASTSIPPA